MTEVWRDVADRLDREAARLEQAAAFAGAVLPDPESHGELFRQTTRGQWRDAGHARSLREAAALLRDAGSSGDPTSRLLSTSVLRVQSWLLARQLEYDARADEAMTALARCTDPYEHPRAVARSAYALGRVRGIRMAGEVWGAAARTTASRNNPP